jgi:hypothetical protein
VRVGHERQDRHGLTPADTASGRRLLNQWDMRASAEGICSTPHFQPVPRAGAGTKSKGDGQEGRGFLHDDRAKRNLQGWRWTRLNRLVVLGSVGRGRTPPLMQPNPRPPQLPLTMPTHRDP